MVTVFRDNFAFSLVYFPPNTATVGPAVPPLHIKAWMRESIKRMII
jgi:hypothetical protein